MSRLVDSGESCQPRTSQLELCREELEEWSSDGSDNLHLSWARYLEVTEVDAESLTIVLQSGVRILEFLGLRACKTCTI